MHGVLQESAHVATGGDETPLPLTYNETRAYLLIQNKSLAEDLVYRFGATADDNAAIVLSAGAVVEYFAPLFMPIGVLHVLGTTGESYLVQYC